MLKSRSRGDQQRYLILLARAVIVSIYPYVLLQYNTNNSLVHHVSSSFLNSCPSSFVRNRNYDDLTNQKPMHRSQHMDIFSDNQHRSSKIKLYTTKKEKNESPTSKEKIKKEVKNDATNKQFLERTKRLIVLIDDEEPIRLAVGDFLYDAGYQVTACADADAFLDLFTTTTIKKEDGITPPPTIPDVIVSDIRMPNSSKDGIDLTKIIRSNDRLSRVPVILLTAKTLTNDRILGYKAGANIYLPKPFDPNELLAIIDNLISRKNQIIEGSTNKGSKVLDLQNEMDDIKYILKQQNYDIDTKSSSALVKSNVIEEDEGIYLTPVELEVLELLSNGYTNGEIATKRNVGIAWVNRVIQKMYMKTGTKTRTELVRWGMKNDQISIR